MKENLVQKFKASENTQLSSTKTLFNLPYSEKKIEKELEKLRKELAKLQDTMYAHNKYSVLVCLQGMDTSGKDSLIREVFKDMNARGVEVHSFKTPTSFELGHDYLWRHYIALPERGKFGVFNRTHYENVLITRVHPNFILNENLPGINSEADITEAFWEKRFDQINQFEKHIAENGTVIFKFFLHISKETQRERLLRRLEEKKHQWKFSPADLKERNQWDLYQKCYQDILHKSCKPHAPWYVIPSDDKLSARFAVAKILLEVMSTYHDIKEPELAPETRQNIELYTKLLQEEK